MTTAVDSEPALTILRAYARGLEIRHIPSATGLDRALVLGVVERDAGLDRAYAKQLVRARDAQAATPAPSTPTPEKTTRARPAPPPAPTPPPVPAAAPAVAAPPATATSRHIDQPRPRRGPQPADPTTGAVTASPPPNVTVTLDATTPPPSAGQDGDAMVTGPDARRWTTYLCERCETTTATAGECCRQPRTRMQVRLHRWAA